MNKISACLIVQNEEKIIKRCLDSIYGVVDEIIVVHDGECGDETLKICKEYNVRIFIRPYAGIMEAHLPFCLEKANGEWILRIDADEFLSKDLRHKLRRLSEERGVDGYEFFWPSWDGGKYRKNIYSHKLSFFRKNKVSFLGLVHFVPEIKGEIIKTDLILEHKPNYNNYSWAMFNKKWKRWAKIQADGYFKSFGDVSKYNYRGSDWPKKIKLRKKFPLFLSPIEFVFTFFNSFLLKKNFKGGFTGLKISFMLGAYRALVDYYIFRQRRQIK